LVLFLFHFSSLRSRQDPQTKEYLVVAESEAAGSANWGSRGFDFGQYISHHNLVQGIYRLDITEEFPAVQDPATSGKELIAI
jgi:hypothetical protein